jgi:tetratricopeptide (TPR) repeat protein
VKRHTEDPDAYDLYLKGIYFWNKRSSESMRKGMVFFQQALEKDPAYSLAYASLADSFNTLGFWGWLAPKEAFPKARAFAERALKIDDTLAEAHNSLGFTCLFYDWEWAAAERELKFALELNPNYAQAHAWYAAYFACLGRIDECIGEYKRALVLDPLSLQIRTLFGEFLRISGRLEEAGEELNRVLDMDPSFGLAHYYLAFTYIQREKYKEAIVSFQKAIKLTGGLPWAIGWRGATYATRGETQKAHKILQDLLELSKQKYIHPSSIAVVYEGFGDLDKFFKWLEIAFKERDPYMPLLKIWHAFTEEEKKIRSDPRFKKLLKKIGLE